MAADTDVARGGVSVRRGGFRCRERGLHKAEFDQALVSLLALRLRRGHQTNHLHQHRHRHLRLILTPEQGSEAEIRFRQKPQSGPPLRIHFSGDARIETTEGAAQIPIKRQELLRSRAGIVIVFARFREIAGRHRGITTVDQILHRSHVETGTTTGEQPQASRSSNLYRFVKKKTKTAE